MHLSKKNMRIAVSIIRQDITDYLIFDCFLFRVTAALFIIVLSFLLSLLNPALGLSLISKAHRAININFTDTIIEKLFVYRYFSSENKRKKIIRIYNTPLTKASKHWKNILFFKDGNINRYFITVVKSSKDNEKGVIILSRSQYFKPFREAFDLNKIGKKYHLYLEPSYAGYFGIDMLSYSQYDFPVLIQAYEPRDFNFIKNLKSNLIPIPLGTHCWVDGRVFKPLNDVTKTFDLIMMSNWAEYKKHYQVFRALSKIKKSGKKSKILLAGYPMYNRTKEDVYEEVKYFGLENQTELVENLFKDGKEKVNYYYNISKAGILWSRKEGDNQAIIEGMFSGVPQIVREGRNYGTKYEYINKYTGIYSSEKELPDKILYMVDHYKEFSPRSWVEEHMSCHKSAAILNEAIKKVAKDNKEVWTCDISVKTNGLGSFYWDGNDYERYKKDYEFLKTTAKR